MELDIYSIDGKKSKKAKLSFVVKSEGNVEHVFYLVDKYQKAFVREGNQSTKTRSEVSGGGAKPYKQKGTGRARRGTSRSGLISGGGVIFGPKPRSFKLNLNNSVFKKAFSAAFEAKEKETIVLAEDDKPKKTKQVVEFLTKLNRKSDDKVLVVSHYDEENLHRACRNVKGLTVCDPTFIPLQELLSGQIIVLTEKALAQVEEMYKG